MYYRSVLTKIIADEAYINLGKLYKFDNKYKKMWLEDNILQIQDENFLNVLKNKKLINNVGPSCKIIEEDLINKVHLQLNNSCMCKCKHCYVGEEGNKSITYDDFIVMIDDFIDKGVMTIDYSGGEPTLHKNFAEIITYGKKQGLNQMLFTNGFIREELYSVIEKNIDIIQVSIDGPEEYHNMFRKNNKVYQNAIKTLERLKDTEVTILVSMSVVNENVEHIPFVVELAKRYNATFRISPPVPMGRNSGKNNLFYERLLEKIKQKCYISGINLEELKPHKAGCSAVRRTVYVDINQNIYPCPLLSETDYLLGNYKKQSLEEILNSESTKIIIKKIEETINTEKKYVFFCPSFFLNMDCSHGFFGEV